MLGVNIPLTEKDKLPPLEEVVKNIKERQDKLQTLEFVMSILSIDGELSKDEIEFLERLLDLLSIDNEERIKYFKIVERCLMFHRSWKAYKEHFLKSSN